MSGDSTAVQAGPKVGVGVMLLRDGKVLLGRRRGGGGHGEATYGWVGGHVEFGETLEGAASREVEEETGIKVKNLEFICVSNVVRGGRHYLDIEFLCKDFEGQPEIREEGRVESWHWFDLDGLPSPLFPAVELAVSSYRSGQYYNK